MTMCVICSPLEIASCSFGECNGLTLIHIIVGGGTAGNALAARLSQGLSSASILVIEAGPFEDSLEAINIPGKRGGTLMTPLDWNFTSIEQSTLANRTVSVDRAKVLGGCSAHNGLVWSRAAVAEYDAWEQLGNEGWNWDSIYAAMLKTENFTNGPSGSGTSGPIQVVRNRYQTPLLDLFQSSCEAAMGISGSNYTLQGDNIGVSVAGPYAISPLHYNASYSTNSYLPEGGDNLSVMTDTIVAKINIQQSSSNSSLYKATGVTLDDGTVITANSEVILSAGTVQSPQLLELSGIGQTDVLSAADISTLIDLEGVGENYQDHQAVALAYQHSDNTSYITTDDLTYNTSFAEEQLDLWYQGEKSIYDIYGGNAFAFVDWAGLVGEAETQKLKDLAKSVVASGDVKDDVITQMRLSLLNDTSVPQVELGFMNGLAGMLPTDGTTPKYYTLQVGLEHALSRGSIHINASNPSGDPVIDPKWFTNDYDIAAAVAMTKHTRNVANAYPLSSVTASEYSPGLLLVPTNATDEQWWSSYVQGNVGTGYHPSSTCAMLPRADGGVVDSNLKVYGTENLRVVDASIIPLLVSAHPTSLVYGIAEIAAEKIIAAAV